MLSGPCMWKALGGPVPITQVLSYMRSVKVTVASLVICHVTLLTLAPEALTLSLLVV
jgi:hypothetical protein